LLAALSFLKQYFHHLPAPTMSSSKPIKGHCNNLGLVQQVTKMQTCKTPNPTWTIENDYDLHNKILQTILCIPSTKLHHVKGHQSNTKQVEDLLYEAILLNIECSKQAHINLETLPINANPHPALPASYPHLHIQNQTIYINTQSTLENTTDSCFYHNYLVKKFKWSDDIPNHIKWGIIELSMHQLKPNNKIQIQKIIHEWISTKNSPGNNLSQEQDHLCPVQTSTRNTCQTVSLESNHG